MSSDNPSNAQSAYQARATHYISHLRVPFDIHERQILNKTPLGVYEFNPTPKRQFWTYLTSGMSETRQSSSSKAGSFTELLFYAKERSLWAVDFLVKLSEYPLNTMSFLPLLIRFHLLDLSGITLNLHRFYFSNHF